MEEKAFFFFLPFFPQSHGGSIGTGGVKNLFFYKATQEEEMGVEGKGMRGEMFFFYENQMRWFLFLTVSEVMRDKSSCSL